MNKRFPEEVTGEVRSEGKMGTHWVDGGVGREGAGIPRGGNATPNRPELLKQEEPFPELRGSEGKLKRQKAGQPGLLQAGVTTVCPFFFFFGSLHSLRDLTPLTRD